MKGTTIGGTIVGLTAPIVIIAAEIVTTMTTTGVTAPAVAGKLGMGCGARRADWLSGLVIAKGAG